MTAPLPRPGIMDIKAYVGGESALEGVSTIIKLSSNEGALGPSPKAAEALRRHGGDIHRYPDGGCTAIRRAIAARFDLDSDRIVCGAGSDELIGLLVKAYAGPGDEVLYSQHGFLMYPIAAKAAGAIPVTAPEVDLTTSVDHLLAAVTERTKIVFVANPNNPTGTYVPESEMRRLRDGLPDGVLLVVDAAYAEFVGRNDYSPGTDLVDLPGANTVMTRTFSKIFALGGLRLGWAYCPAEIADVLNRVRNPFNVSSAAQIAGVAAMEDLAFADLTRAHNDYWQPWLAEQLTALGLVVVPSVCNFILVHFPTESGKNAAAADAFLRRRGLIVRAMTSYGLPGSLRITIGRDEEMWAVAAALAEFMA